MLIGVEIDILGLDGVDVVLVEEGNEFLVDKVDALSQTRYILRLVHSVGRTLKIVNQREHLGEYLLAGGLHQAEFLLLGTAAIVVILCHHTQILVLQLGYTSTKRLDLLGLGIVEVRLCGCGVFGLRLVLYRIGSVYLRGCFGILRIFGRLRLLILGLFLLCSLLYLLCVVLLPCILFHVIVFMFLTHCCYSFFRSAPLPYSGSQSMCQRDNMCHFVIVLSYSHAGLAQCRSHRGAALR